MCSRYVHTGECARQGIAYDKIEAMVLDVLRDTADNPHHLDHLTFAPPENRHGATPKRLKAKLHEIPLRIDRQVQAYEAGVISLDDLRIARDRLRVEEESLRAQLVNTQEEHPDMQAFTARLDEALHMVLSDAPLHAKRKALLRVISHITWSKTQQRLEIVWRRP